MEKNTFVFNQKIVRQVKMLEAQGDVIVPDAKPDIVSILGANANPYIYKEEVSDGKYRFDGNVDTRILYLAENGETKCMQTTLDFMDMIEDAKLTEQTQVKYRIELLSVDAKVLNERKINVCVSLRICFHFFQREAVEYGNSLKNMTGIEKLEETVDLDTLVAANQVKSSLKENIASEGAVVDILNADIAVTNQENKISYNKVLSKADVEIQVLYLTESGKVAAAQMTVPIMNFIDMENVSDEDTCQTDYKIRNMLFKPNTQDMKTISCQIDFEVSCEVYRQKTMNIVQDMYGIDKNVTFQQRQMQVPQEQSDVREAVNMRENILVEDIRSLHTVDCRAHLTQQTRTGNTTNCEGEVCLGIYYETGNNLGVKAVTIPFVAKLAGDAEDIDMQFVTKNFSLQDENVSCDLVLELKSGSGNYRTINILEDVQEEPLEEENDYAMVIYFVKAGDTIWSIARNFRVSMDSIKQINNLQEHDKIGVGEKLYIMK